MAGILSLVGFEKTTCSGLIALANTIDKYKDKPDDIRFCLLVDKVKLILDVMSSFGPLFSSMDVELLGKTESAIKDIREEFDQLENYIIGKRQLEHKQIIQKLDTVLLGPDYQEGRQMMEAAKTDFYGKTRDLGVRTPRYKE